MNGKSRVAIIVAFCTVLPLGGNLLAETLSGRVYEGQTGTEPPTATAIQGVTVSLYGSNNAGDDGTGDLPIQTTTTNSEGWYSLTVRGAYDFYNIVQTNKTGYVDSAPTPAAASVGGTVKSSNWIQYGYEDIFVTPVTSTGNKFWDQQEGQPPENNPPVANDDSATTPQDTAVDINVLANDSDPDGDSLHVNSATDPAHGTTVNHGSHVTYTPDPGFTGTDTFDYTAGDGKGGTDTATVTVTVVGDEEPPADKGTIRGVKFNDLNGNGVRDPGEPGLPGWRIELWLYENGDFWDWTHIATTTTDASGAYAFEPSSSGQYQVREENKSGWTQTYPSGHHTVSFNTSQTIEDLDFGNHREGGFDFGDAPDSYGTLHASGGPYHDVGEVLMGSSIDAEPDGQPGAGADGDDSSGGDEDGVTFLGTLAPGGFASVLVEITAPLGVPAAVTGWIDFDRNGGFDDPAERIAGGIYTGAGTTVPWTQTFTIPATAATGPTYARFRIYRTEPGVDVFPAPGGYGGEGEVEDYRIDIGPGGDLPPAGNLITGIKFNDLDGDGVWEPADGELRLPNWTIWLDEDNDGTPDKTTVTNSQGGFDFAGLSPGTYTVGEEQQPGWMQTTPQAPGTFTVTIPGGPQPTAHFLMFGNTRSGGRDYGDAPLPYPAASHELGGPYLGLFGDVPDPESGMQRDAWASGDDSDAGGDDENGLLSINLVKTAGAWSTWELKGYFGLSSDAKFGLWIDFNGDGDWDDLNELWATFGFCGFGAGPQDWFHAMGAFQLPADAKVGTTYARLRVYGDCNASLSAAGDAGPGEVEDYLVEIKADGPGVPAGGIVHGYKWNDIDGDGLWDILVPNEPPLTGWTFWLDTNHNGIQDAADMTTQTDGQGHFRFTGVPAGTYTLGEQLQPGWTQTTPGGTGTYSVTVQPGQASFPQMFGNRQSGGSTNDGRICGSKWDDQDGNGVYDAGEPWLANWRVYLDLNHNGHWDAGEPSQLTNAGGSFEFAGLAAGSYTVAEEIQTGWQQTWPGGAGTHTISIQPGGAQPACVMFGNTQRPVPPPDTLKKLDWGDAPDPAYPTLRTSNGAYHVIAPGFHLGQSIDDEPDGQPTPDALGDDHFGADDEDGIIFLTPILPGGMAGLEIAASAAGFVDAWIDFDADGNWSQPGDRILTADPVAAGSNVLNVAIPASAQVNVATFARFRLSRAGGLPPEGPGQDGEVEDYHVLIGPEGPGVPGEGQRPHVKWSQPPIEIDLNPEAPPVFCGWDEPARSTQSSGQRRQWRMDADDFRCLGPIPITGLRWWGGYKGWTRPEPPEFQPEAWHIGFWANQVQGLAPDELYLERFVWSLEVANERVRREPVGLDEFPESLPAMCFQYQLALEPEEWFHQAEFPSSEGVFWISITAIYPPDAEQQNQWGWKTRPHVWRDGAVMPALMGEWPTYEERLFPGRISPIENSVLCGQNQPYDLCFELLTERPWVKWDQPFTGIREWPDYTDLESQGTSIRDEENIGRIVADDWLCERDTPVIAAAWWGSYIGYGYEACRCDDQREPPRPDYFLLTISTSIGPDHEADYARPGDVVWQYRAYEYDEVLVGYDRNPEGEPNEPVFRYSVRLPADSWFRQETPGTLYWFSVTAVYTDPLPQMPPPWGWTNHPPVFGTGASFIDYRARPRPEWRLLRDPADRPVDMSFTLFTLPQE